MFKFFENPRFFIIVPFVVFGLVLLLFFYAYQLDEAGSEGQETIAPFSSVVGKPVISEQTGTTENELEKTLISSREIAVVLNDIIAETLNFNKENYSPNTRAVKSYFTEYGYKQYQEFLESTGFNGVFISTDLQSGAYLEQPPLEVSSGVYNGAYKWLFEVPITLNFFPKNLKPGDENTTSSMSRRMTLRVQFTRVKDPIDPSAIKIEIWQALPAR